MEHKESPKTTPTKKAPVIIELSNSDLEAVMGGVAEYGATPGAKPRPGRCPPGALEY